MTRETQGAIKARSRVQSKSSPLEKRLHRDQSITGARCRVDKSKMTTADENSDLTGLEVATQWSFSSHQSVSKVGIQGYCFQCLIAVMVVASIAQQDWQRLLNTATCP